MAADLSLLRPPFSSEVFNSILSGHFPSVSREEVEESLHETSSQTHPQFSHEWNRLLISSDHYPIRFQLTSAEGSVGLPGEVNRTDSARKDAM